MIVNCGSCRVDTSGKHEAGCPNAPRVEPTMSSNVYRCGCPHCKGHVVGATTVTYTVDIGDPVYVPNT